LFGQLPQSWLQAIAGVATKPSIMNTTRRLIKNFILNSPELISLLRLLNFLRLAIFLLLVKHLQVKDNFHNTGRKFAKEVFLATTVAAG